MFLSNLFPWMGNKSGAAVERTASTTTEFPSCDSATLMDVEIEESSPLSCQPIATTSNNAKKRSRTPELVRSVDDSSVELRPVKLFRTNVNTQIRIYRTPTVVSALPEDVLEHVFGFLGVQDRFALQTTNQQFRKISNRSKLLKQLDVSSIIQEDDDVSDAVRRLDRFAQASNPQALYMLGIIHSYCACNVKKGISLLKQAATQDYVRASYALGLVLRDANPRMAHCYMQQAAAKNYLPALQETLSSTQMKQKFGEPSSDMLAQHLDFLNLNLLLKKHYCTDLTAKRTNTSHCWNPKCGRWAYKANSTVQGSVSRMKMCSRCCRAKYCSKLCQVYDWRSGRHKLECQFL